MRPFSSDRSGGTAVVFAISLFVLAGVAGFAMDFTAMNRAKGVIQGAGDSAALAYAKTYTAKGGTEKKAEEAATHAFNANLSAHGLGTVTLLKPVLLKDKKGKASAVQVTFESSVPLSFGGLIGVPTKTVGGLSAVNLGTSEGSVAIVVDVSDSMGLAATEADRDKMRAGYYGCEFACHTPDASVGPENPLTVARSLNVKLRIDVARDAIETLVNSIEKGGLDDKVKIGLYAFNQSFYKVQEISNGTPALVRKAAKDIDLGYGVGPTDLTQTDLDTLFPTLETTFGPSKKDQNSSIILITDGLHSQIHGAPFTEVKPVDPKACQGLKDKGHTVAILYTRYLEATDSAPFNSSVAPVFKDIEPNLMACASPGYFAHGDTPEEIEAAMLQIFGKLEALYVSQ
ncbi:TadE/TadG family type IV pilus assembly protein [Chthonobacter albigriseus]|uniref:TadE/TadG family type IV pilus assembly protein n=1 Tax=Chthonobacter albigriseus TaxID=1683161 RepID=UPI0015EFD00C|nr:TadE/TadG family type IV pilus assembly protein [Chthonobacter albigriseus]